MSRTDPMRVSAPLPVDSDIDWTDPQLVREEILRSQTELMWALHRQRTAWTKMANLKKIADARGISYFMDNERSWTLALGDVKWWRGEVSARSNSLMALIQLAALMGLDLGPKWAETTDLGALARGVQTFVRADPVRKPPRPSGDSDSVRNIVWSWKRGTQPNEQQINAARTWRKLVGQTPDGKFARPADAQQVKALLDAAAAPR